VTEKLRSDAELRRAKGSLELALDAAELGTWDLDLTSGDPVLSWSDGYGRLFGLGPGEFPRTEAQFFELVHPDDRALVRQRFGQALGGDVRYECEFRIICPDGSVRWHLGLGRALRDETGRPIRMLGVGKDITDRKRSEERMHLATQATSVGLWELNIKDGSFRCDEQVFRIYGYPPTQDGLVPYSVWRNAVLPEDWARVEAAFGDTLRRLGSSTNEYRIRRRNDGEVRTVQVIFTVHADATGNAEWVVGTSLDVTERRRAESDVMEKMNELRRSYELMLGRESRVQELKREINRLLKDNGQPVRYPSEDV
jgi:PAS domain S-box-containing protein